MFVLGGNPLCCIQGQKHRNQWTYEYFVLNEKDGSCRFIKHKGYTVRIPQE